MIEVVARLDMVGLLCWRQLLAEVRFRGVLYTATRHNTRIMAICQRLVAQGKPKKLALVATMRKLPTILNTLIKRDERWSEPNA